jgi:hypothetical protein
VVQILLRRGCLDRPRRGTSAHPFVEPFAVRGNIPVAVGVVDCRPLEPGLRRLSSVEKGRFLYSTELTDKSGETDAPVFDSNSVLVVRWND